MQRPMFTRSGVPIEEADVRAAEEAIGFRLPPKLRAFLLHYNGGVPAKPYFRIADHFEGEDTVREFLDIDEVVADWRTFHEYASRGLLPIGWGEFGCMICVDVSTPGAKPVLYMEIADEDPPDARRPYLLASDIDDFCDRLEEEPELPEPPF